MAEGDGTGHRRHAARQPAGHCPRPGLTTLVAATVSELYYDVPQMPCAERLVPGQGRPARSRWHRARGLVSGNAGPHAAADHAVACRPGTIDAAPVAASWHRQGGNDAGRAAAWRSCSRRWCHRRVRRLFVVLLGAALLDAAGAAPACMVLDHFADTAVWRMAVRDLDRHLSRLGTAAAAPDGGPERQRRCRGDGREHAQPPSASWLGDLLSADLYIASGAFDDAATLPQSIVPTAPRLAPVRDKATTATARCDGNRRITLVAADITALPHRLDFRRLQIDGDSSHGPASPAGAVLISGTVAGAEAAGDVLRLPTPAGDAGFPVAAVFSRLCERARPCVHR